MKEYKIKLYHFDELNEDAKAKVCDKEREDVYGNFGTMSQETNAQERIATLDKFCEEFGIEYDVDMDHCHRFISWHFTSVEDEDATGKYLLRFLNKHHYSIRDKKYYSTAFRRDENGKFTYKHRHSRIMYQDGVGCPFTGCCYDCDILDKIFDWYKAPDWNLSIHDLFEDCFSHFLHLWDEEDDYCMSDEHIGEMIEINWGDKLYFEDGTEYTGQDLDEVCEVA